LWVVVVVVAAAGGARGLMRVVLVDAHVYTCPGADGADDADCLVGLGLFLKLMLVNSE
jgi:hypothetical protein